MTSCRTNSRTTIFRARLTGSKHGSIFKPWVYAAAMNTAITGGSRTLTPATTVVDEPTTFWYDNKPYEPNNFEHEFYGVVTLRRALAKSMNVATIKVAEMVGYGAVVG